MKRGRRAGVAGMAALALAAGGCAPKRDVPKAPAPWLSFVHGSPELRASVDCPAHRARTLPVIRRDAAGTVVEDRTYAGREEGAWTPFDAHDLGEHHLLSLCGTLQEHPGRAEG